MEQKSSSPGYAWPLAINALLVFNIVLAMVLANAHQRDGYLGGLGYVFYAGLSILVSTVINLVAFTQALTKGSAVAKVIYGVAALGFFVVSAMVLYSFAHMGNLKPGG
jgi:hypothetical protein